MPRVGRSLAVNFFHTHVSPEAIKLATETLCSTYISEGRRVRQFEETLAGTLGVVRPVTVNSGTSALHLALEVAGIGQGDEVILPAQTFVASGLAVLMAGARPIFADIQPRTGNIDPQSIAAHITSRSKAVMPVHWGGYPCDMDEINEIAREHRLAVIEDAAHALGASYRSRPVGVLSRFTAFSFQAIKHLTTGDGGALCCLFEEDYEEARRRRWFGIDRMHDKTSILGERIYDLEKVGFKYHLNDIAASIGLGNLLDIPANLVRHRHIAARYRQELEGISGIEHLDQKSDRTGSYWIYTLLVAERENFIRALKARGVPASVVHQRIDRNRVFGGMRCDLEGLSYFDERQVSLPIHCGLTDQDVDCVVQSVRAGW
jgi:perosamine synthetase